MRYRWPPDIGHLVDVDRVILALLPDGEPKALTGSGAAIWLYADGLTVGEIADELATAYGVDASTLLGGVEEYCAELVSVGFLVAE